MPPDSHPYVTTRPVADAGMLKPSKGPWEVAGTCSSWSLFHFPFRILPGMDDKTGWPRGASSPLLLKGQGDPVGWLHP